MLADISYESLKQAYSSVGITEGKVVYVTGDITKVGISLSLSKFELLNLHLKVIMDLIGPEGTIVVPTHSFSLCNTNIPFSLKNTPSETGAFSEFIRNQTGSIRQLHPFSSRTAIGKEASYICENTAPHSYGMHTPFSRMLELDSMFISVGIHPKQIVSLVHQCESDMNVPYRYTKEFIHPVETGQHTEMKAFYHLVTYLNCDIKRDKNVKIFENFEKKFKLNHSKMCQGSVWGFNMSEFYKATTELMREDIYSWLVEPPNSRPYQV